MILVPIRFDHCFRLYSRVANQKLIEPLTATAKNRRVHISAIRLPRCRLTFTKLLMPPNRYGASRLNKAFTTSRCALIPKPRSSAAGDLRWLRRSHTRRIDRSLGRLVRLTFRLRLIIAARLRQSLRARKCSKRDPGGRIARVRRTALDVWRGVRAGVRRTPR